MSITKNLADIKASITKAQATYHREDHPYPPIDIIAVSKKQPDTRIQEALDIGLRSFGENRVQEAQEHWGKRRALYPDLHLHLIGPLQTNKVKDAVALFDTIQTLDREKLARAIAKDAQKQNKNIACMIQINTGEEPQKAGIHPDELSGFLAFCRDECALNITGLMCIPPAGDPPSLHFALLKKLADIHNLPHISMGMSSDYQHAAVLGATHIRIGTGVFGARD